MVTRGACCSTGSLRQISHGDVDSGTDEGRCGSLARDFLEPAGDAKSKSPQLEHVTNLSIELQEQSVIHERVRTADEGLGGVVRVGF
jgi:hypothetical protein